MPDREKLRALTPEDRMTAAIKAAVAEWGDKPILADATEESEKKRLLYVIRWHGAAAIEAALAEQRARIVAWLNREPPYTGREHHEDLAILADQIHEREPEAWAERTGWKMEETGDAAA